MAFAGQLGVSLNIDLLVTESDGIGDSRAEYGDSKNWATQVGERRSELTLKALFNEELGVVIQVPRAERDAVMALLRKHGLGRHSHAIGKINDKRIIEVWRDAKAVFSAPLRDLQQAWDEVSWRIARLRDNPDCADAEHAAVGADGDTGLHVQLSFDPAEAPALLKTRPKVAILREQGVNSHVEMAYAMAQAGFDSFDVHMSDLQSGRARLDMFQAFVACGGFSYGDTLGAGEGWARSILFNPVLADQFAAFFNRADTLALGVCNGCQMMAALSPIIPGAAAWPKFTRNKSEQFEARLSLVEVLPSPSLFFTGMAGSRLPIAVAHGEGFADFSQRGDAAAVQRAMRFVDGSRQPDRGLSCQPERQPRRPDGSDHRRRPLHRADAAPGARVPQCADELDCRRPRRATARGCACSTTRGARCPDPARLVIERLRCVSCGLAHELRRCAQRCARVRARARGARGPRALRSSALLGAAAGGPPAAWSTLALLAAQHTRSVAARGCSGAAQVAVACRPRMWGSESGK